MCLLTSCIERCLCRQQVAGLLRSDALLTVSSRTSVLRLFLLGDTATPAGRADQRKRKPRKGEEKRRFSLIKGAEAPICVRLAEESLIPPTLLCSYPIQPNRGCLSSFDSCGSDLKESG